MYKFNNTPTISSAKPSQGDKHGRIKLHYAARDNNFAEFIILFNEAKKNSPTDLLSRDNYGKSLLHFAAEGGNASILELLLAEPEVNLPPYDQDLAGKTPLHYSNGDTTKLLLGKLTKPAKNALDKKKETALHVGARDNRSALVELLLADAEVSPDIRNDEGKTPLHLAVEWHNTNIVKKLLAHLDKNAQEIRDFKYRTALHIACEITCRESVQLLVSDSLLNLCLQDKYLQTPLHKAVMHKPAANNKDTAIVKMILTALTEGHNIQDNNEKTPLHLAVNHNWVEAVELLLTEPKVEVNIRDKNGQTPLHLAVINGNIEIVKLLLKKEGLRLDIVDSAAMLCHPKSKIKPLLENAKEAHRASRENASPPLRATDWNTQTISLQVQADAQKGVDYYEILGIKNDASEKEIKSNYRSLAIKFHPDKQGGKEELFKMINRAYEGLLNCRADYDFALANYRLQAQQYHFFYNATTSGKRAREGQADPINNKQPFRK